MYKIAIVEDEPNLASLVKKYLDNEGYDVIVFEDGESASTKISDEIDLWILDIMLPGVITGYDLLKDIKKANSLKPIVFTSARDQDIDRIMGLELGSDDYLAKPYSIRELVLRVKNILSRTYAATSKGAGNIEKISDYVIDYDKRIVYYNNENINLTSKEYDLLFMLIKNKAKAYSREQILNAIWGNDYFGSDRVVDDLIRRIRSKMPNLQIETIYGYGYRFL